MQVMRHATNDVMITVIIDIVLIPLMEIGNIPCVSLAIIVMNASAINLITMTLSKLILY